MSMMMLNRMAVVMVDEWTNNGNADCTVRRRVER
jgi:hypothetical protein